MADTQTKNWNVSTYFLADLRTGFDFKTSKEVDNSSGLNTLLDQVIVPGIYNPKMFIYDSKLNDDEYVLKLYIAKGTSFIFGYNYRLAENNNTIALKKDFDNRNLWIMKWTANRDIEVTLDNSSSTLTQIINRKIYIVNVECYYHPNPLTKSSDLFKDIKFSLKLPKYDNYLKTLDESYFLVNEDESDEKILQDDSSTDNFWTTSLDIALIYNKHNTNSIYLNNDFINNVIISSLALPEYKKLNNSNYYIKFNSSDKLSYYLGDISLLTENNNIVKHTKRPIYYEIGQTSINNINNIDPKYADIKDIEFIETSSIESDLVNLPNNKNKENIKLILSLGYLLISEKQKGYEIKEIYYDKDPLEYEDAKEIIKPYIIEKDNDISLDARITHFYLENNNIIENIYNYPTLNFRSDKINTSLAFLRNEIKYIYREIDPINSSLESIIYTESTTSKNKKLFSIDISKENQEYLLNLIKNKNILSQMIDYIQKIILKDNQAQSSYNKTIIPIFLGFRRVLIQDDNIYFDINNTKEFISPENILNLYNIKNINTKSNISVINVL